MFNSIFQKDWWLDAVAPGRWGEAVVRKGDNVAARLPYVIERKDGLTLLTMPPLTQTLGPWLRRSNAKYANELAEQKDLMTELIQKLPPHDYFSQNFHYSITNWLPFCWQGFQQTTRYTYIIDNLNDSNRLWSELLPGIRSDIKKAKNRFELEVRTDLGIEAFLNINQLTFKRQGMSLPYPRDLVCRLDADCKKRNARKIFFAHDKEGKIHAAVYIVWDENSAYYLMGGGDPELRNSGATSLCMWEAIKFASTVTKKFDFEGSMIEPVERFFRAFGARQVPYFQITKDNRPVLKRGIIAGKAKIGGAIKRLNKLVS